MGFDTDDRAKAESAAERPWWARLRSRLFHLWFLIRRPMTLGVRGVIYDRAGDRVLLIRHTYVRGWQFPGGGVESGETMLDALRREIVEECNVEISGQPVLKSVHLNLQASRRDHVAVYLIEDFRRLGPKQPDIEIAEAGFFPRTALPDATTPATRRRLAEIFDGQVPAAHW